MIQDSRVAVVGMAGRFPKAPSIEELWARVLAKESSVEWFEDDVLRAAGVPEETLCRNQYVKASAPLTDIDLFDASLFEISSEEAERMDPQHRILLECAWQALENAGYLPLESDGPVTGVFAGASRSGYLLHALDRIGFEALRHDQQFILGTEPDFLSLRIAYKLNLRGPCMGIQSACSTGLLAVHQACRSLLQGECDMALAGAVGISVPQISGYIYEQGGPLSPDGHCRPFDISAAGTVPGSGAGMVVLKRQSDAFADRDYVHANILGSAANNDGSSKIGFMAPSASGQATVVAQALQAAGVSARTIGFVEAHGTGTVIGDPVEVAGLTDAYRRDTPEGGYCALGSVKSCVGHLDSAAGIAGLVVGIMAVRDGLIPPVTNFDTPNPELHLGDSPFYINTSVQNWPTQAHPRRAGVSSLGFGGTNVHVVIEEPPAGPARPPGDDRLCKIPLSARSASGLADEAQLLAKYLRQHHKVELRDVEFTLRTSRPSYPFRDAITPRSREEAITSLDACSIRVRNKELRYTGGRPVVFLIPGQGLSVHPAAVLDLYETEPAFSHPFDECRMHVDSEYDLLGLARAAANHSDERHRLESATSLLQPFSFSVSYALTQLWRSWGVKPSALIGHSLGEYVAACTAGSISCRHALKMVVHRAKLMSLTPHGCMLAVFLPEEEIADWLSPGIWIAAVNAPDVTVVSGRCRSISELAHALAQKGIACRLLPTSHAFHSDLMKHAASGVALAFEDTALTAPRLPFISGVTGSWAGDEITHPSYWSRQMVEPVRFSSGIQTILDSSPATIFLELGFKRVLSSLVCRHYGVQQEDVVPLQGNCPPLEGILMAIENLWRLGADINWTLGSDSNAGRRVPLPGVPLMRDRYWLRNRIADRRSHADETRGSGDQPPPDWLWRPTWRRAPHTETRSPTFGRRVFLLSRGDALGNALRGALHDRDAEVVVLHPGDAFSVSGDRTVQVQSDSEEDFRKVIGQFGAPDCVIHAWCSSAETEDVLRNGLLGLLGITKAVVSTSPSTDLRVAIIAPKMFDVLGSDINIDVASIPALATVCEQEWPTVSCICLDPGESDREYLADRLVNEVIAASGPRVVAYRGVHRWLRDFEPIVEDPPGTPKPLSRDGKTYLVTGGLGRLGLILAQALATSASCNVLLTTRRDISDGGWHEVKLSSPFAGNMPWVDDALSRGSRIVVVQADSRDETAMVNLIQEAERRLGGIAGLLHTAGLPREGIVPLPQLDRGTLNAQFDAKVSGARILARALSGFTLDYVVLFSSLAGILGGLGLGAYAAANAALDAVAVSDLPGVGDQWKSVAWDGWALDDDEDDARYARARGDNLIAPSDGLRALQGALRLPDRYLAVATGNLPNRIVRSQRKINVSESKSTFAKKHDPPYTIEPGEIETVLSKTWREVLELDTISPEDDLLMLGADSLMVLQVQHQLRNSIGADVPLRVFMESRSLAELIPRVIATLTCKDKASTSLPLTPTFEGDSGHDRLEN